MPDWFLGTLLGAVLTLLITWLERRFHVKTQKERLFKALFEEIKMNYSMAKRLRERYKEPEWTVFEAAPLHTLAYQNIRGSGELGILSRDTLSLLEETYEMIHANNRQVRAILTESGGPPITFPDGVMLPPVTRDRGLWGRIKQIEANLRRLEQELARQFRFLR